MKLLERTADLQKIGAMLAIVLVVGCALMPIPAFARLEGQDPFDPLLNPECWGPNANNGPECEFTGDDLAEGTGQVAEDFAHGLGALVLQVVVGISYVILNFSNFLLYLAGTFFNNVMYETVFKFGENFGNSPGLIAAWGVLRDLGNIFLLFSFIFIGLATILNLHNYTMKKALPRLLIFAVLLNFSLFAAEAVIDVSNGVSIAISGTSIANDECDITGAGTDDTPQEICAKTVGLSGTIMTASGLSSAFTPPATSFDIADTIDLEGALVNITMFLALSLFSTIMTVVLLAAGIMLIIRALVLLIIIASSPIGFAGMVVPFMDGIAKKWWDELIKQSLFVPVFLLIVFIGITILNHSPLAAARLQENGFAGALASGSIDATGIFVTFALVIGFLLAALKIAKDFGAHGADFAIKTAGGLTYGSFGFIGRRTLGAGAYRVAESIRRSKLGNTELGRALLWAPDRMAKGSFDFRSVGGKIPGWADMGHADGAAHHGFHGITESEKEKKVNFFNSVNDARERELEELETRLKVLKTSGAPRSQIDALEEKIHNLPIHRSRELSQQLEQGQAEMGRLNEQLRAAQGEIRTQRDAIESGRRILAEAQAQSMAATTPEARRAAEAQIEAAEAQINAAETQLRMARERSIRGARDREAMQRTLAGLEASLAQMRDSYAMQLARGATGFWGRVNPVMRFANLEAIERIMKYRNDPGSRSMDDFKKSLLRGISDISAKAGSPHIVLPSESGGGGHGGGGGGH